VIEISSEDAKEAQAKWDALQKAQKDWDDLQVKIGEKYTSEPSSAIKSPTVMPPSICGNTLTWVYPGQRLQGWENGFVFSPDFKFIVPKTPAVNSNGCGSSGITFIPSIGNWSGTWNNGCNGALLQGTTNVPSLIIN
jgi:hypothetical protein